MCGVEEHSPLSDCGDDFPVPESAQCSADTFWAPNRWDGTHKAPSSLIHYRCAALKHNTHGNQMLIGDINLITTLQRQYACSNLQTYAWKRHRRVKGKNAGSRLQGWFPCPNTVPATKYAKTTDTAAWKRLSSSTTALIFPGTIYCCWRYYKPRSGSLWHERLQWHTVHGCVHMVAVKCSAYLCR